MRRPLPVAVLLLCALLVAATVPLPVSAHSNHLSATSQVSADGSVVVESVFTSQRAHLVVHANDGGELGEALGSRPLAADGMQRNVEVAVDAAAWERWGERRTVWVALHADDGDGEYDADDSVFTLFGRRVAERIAVGKGDAAVVTGRGFLGQQTAAPELSVGRVTLPGDGLLVVRDDGTDAVVGTRALSAGTHDDVTVDLNASYFESRSGSFTVRAQLYRDDGDGAFGDGDRSIRAGDAPVETVLPVSAGGAAANGTAPAMNTPTQPAVNTPVETTASGTAPGDGTSTSSPASTTDSSGSGPGFGVGLAVLAVAVAVSLARLAGRR